MKRLLLLLFSLVLFSFSLLPTPSFATFGEGWWKTAVFYQVYTRSFVDSNGDGVGDFPGLTNKLDYLKSLGVGAIWISPHHPSPQADYGYDVTDYYGVDPSFGTLAQFDELIAACHERNIAVVMDLVVNHTSDQHPWFMDSAKGGEKKDWYLWREGKPGGAVPNNWLARVGMGTSGWKWSPQRRSYYYHSFLSSQPDLNWRNPAVRDEIKKIMEFWLARGVNGFRLDVLNYYLKDAQFRDNPSRGAGHLFSALASNLTWGQWFGQVGQQLFYSYAGQEHRHDKDQEGVLDILQEFRATVAPYHGVILGEVDSDDGAAQAARSYGPHGEGVHLAFNMDLMELPWDAHKFYQAIHRWQRLLPAEGWPALAFSNHDRVRSISRYENSIAKAKILLTLQMTMRGTPVLYYGEEIGMLEGKFTEKEIRDPAYFTAKLNGPLSSFSWPGRDGCRTPMQWTPEAGGGFSAGLPWLKANGSGGGKNVAEQEVQGNSLLSITKKLSRLRSNCPSLSAGMMAFVSPPLDARVLAYYRGDRGERILIITNFNAQRIYFPYPHPRADRVLLAEGEGETTLSSAGFMLAPYAIVIYSM